MGFSIAYTTGNKTSEAESLETLARARQLGVIMLDTANAYGFGANEQLLAKVLKDNRDAFFLATKFALTMDDQQNFGVRGDPEHVRQACDKSLDDLGIQTIDLYYQHRVDKKVPIEDTVRAMAELVKAGKVKYLGLSEVTGAQIRAAHAVHPITAVQLEWSLWERGAEADVIPTCRELGIAIVAYSPLGRGFLTGQIRSHDDIPDDDFRKHVPRFSKENFAKNIELVHKVEAIAARLGATSGQVALAWLHAQGPDVFPIPGTRRSDRLQENVEAFALSEKLTKQDLDELEACCPVNAAIGDRYMAAFMSDTFEGVNGSK
jgi:aryl-alcohol dehydrogenase-like predicted oxidoreductase